MALREEAVGDAVRERLAEPARVREARAGSPAPSRRPGRWPRSSGRSRPSASVSTGESLPITVSVNSISRPSSVVAEHLRDPAARGVLAEAGRDPAVDLQVRPRRDHVDLVGRVRHRRRQRHAEHRLDQRQQRRLDLADPLERGRRDRRGPRRARAAAPRALGQRRTPAAGRAIARAPAPASAARCRRSSAATRARRPRGASA